MKHVLFVLFLILSNYTFAQRVELTWGNVPQKFEQTIDSTNFKLFQLQVEGCEKVRRIMIGRISYPVYLDEQGFLFHPIWVDKKIKFVELERI